MTAKIIFASDQLGSIANTQLQAMLNRFHLGELLSSRRTENGAMGQTMFVSSTEGDYILKGNPLFPGQFDEEKFFIENLQKRMKITVPVPYIIDRSDDIFGWSYSLMPCLQGEHMNSQQMETRINKRDKLKIAKLVAQTLAVFHQWKVGQFGELDPEYFSISPFEEGYTEWLFNRIRFWLEDAKKYSTISSKDIVWVEALLEKAKGSFDTLASATFVMGDFKPGNFLLNRGANGWEISGVFDFTNAYFGDPLADLIKMLTSYLDSGEKDLAKYFLSVYLDSSQEVEAIKQRLHVHMLQQRILDWGCAKAIGMVTWDDTISFSEWAGNYIKLIGELLD